MYGEKVIMGHMIEEKKTKVFLEEYKGNKTFSIWEVDDLGNKSGKIPVIGFGIVKAKAILKHLEDIKEFVYGKPSCDVDKDL